MRNDNSRKTSIILSVCGIVPVVWFALLTAPYVSGGMVEIVNGLPVAMSHPFAIRMCEDSLKTVLLFLLAYAMGIGIYFSTRRNYRRREEHGSAKWGNTGTLNKKYRDKDPSANKLLTQNVRIGLDGRKHRRNLNILVCGGSGAGKTRFFCKPNAMQCNTSFVILDPKGEIVRDIGGLLEKKGYEVRVLDLINMHRSHCYNPFVLKTLEKQARQLTPTEPLDETYKRIQYTRYADDFIIGVIGSKADAEQIKADVGRFLREELDLEMSETKTKVTHTGDRARFLGYDITVSRSQDLKKSAGGYKIRSNAGVVKLLVPREKWVGKLLEYHAIKIKINENGKERFVALHRGKLVNQSDIEILARYNAEVRGLYNYYAIANDSFKIGRFANLMKYSMYKTFACKYKTNVHEIKRRYCVGGLFTIAYDTRAGRKTTTFYRDGFKRKESATKFDNVSELPQFSKYAKTNTLKQRVERHTCELCGKDCRNLEIHQVKKLKDLKGNAEWVLLMRKRRRKTLVVCPECHKLIHS